MPWGRAMRPNLRGWRAHLRRVDPKLFRAIARLGPYRPTRQPATFATLCEAILYQQLAGAAAAAIHCRFVLLFPGRPGRRFPKPKDVARTPIPRLRSAGLSRAKALTVKDLARKTLDGTVAVRSLRHLSDTEVIEHLTSVRGIGRWTADMFLIFSLGRLDIFPALDFGVAKGFQRAFGLSHLPKLKFMERRAERWRPYRSVASWYLWRIVDVTTPAG